MEKLNLTSEEINYIVEKCFKPLTEEEQKELLFAELFLLTNQYEKEEGIENEIRAEKAYEIACHFYAVDEEDELARQELLLNNKSGFKKFKDLLRHRERIKKILGEKNDN